VRAVIDTNIWLRALISPHGAPAKVLEAYRAGRFTVVASLPLLEEEELEDVLCRPELARKIKLPQAALDLPAYLRQHVELVEIDGQLSMCRDPKDDKFIETAVRGRANCLVSMDKDLYDAPDLCEVLSRLGIHVMLAHLFLMEIGDS
jgi:putative PIN family toxin of toxin-antitoxin system